MAFSEGSGKGIGKEIGTKTSPLGPTLGTKLAQTPVSVLPAGSFSVKPVWPSVPFLPLQTKVAGLADLTSTPPSVQPPLEPLKEAASALVPLVPLEPFAPASPLGGNEKGSQTHCVLAGLKFGTALALRCVG